MTARKAAGAGGSTRYDEMKVAKSSSKQTAEHLFVCIKLKNPKWYAVDGKELCRDNDLTRSRGSSARATRKK